MEAAEPIKPETLEPNLELDKIEFIKKLIVKGEHEILFGIKKNNNELVIRVIREKSKDFFYFQKNYTLLEIQELSKVFLIYESIEELIAFLIQKKFDIEEKDDKLIIKFNICLPDSKNKLIELKLKKIQLDTNYMIKYCIEEIKLIQKEIKKSEESINKLSCLKEEYKNILSILNKNNKKEIKEKRIMPNLKEEIFNKLTHKNNILLLIIFAIIFYKFYIYNISQSNYNLNDEKEIFYLKEENKKLSEAFVNLSKNYTHLLNLITNNEKEILNSKEEISSLTKVLNKLNKEYKNTREKLYDLNKITDKLIEIEYPIISYFDSEIIEPKYDINFVLEHIEQNNGSFKYNKMQLLFRGSRDGDSTKKCHELCDNKKNILIIIKSDSVFIFGGYTEIGFKTYNNFSDWKHLVDNKSFLFSIDLKKIYPVMTNKEVICQLDEKYGLNFYQGFSFIDNFMNSSVNYIGLNIKEYFNNVEYDYEINGDKRYFKIDELEVFQLL